MANNEEGKYTKMAKWHFKERLYGGLFASTLGFVISIMMFIFFFVKKDSMILLGAFAMLAVSLLVGISCGYVLYKFTKEEEEQRKKNKKEE